MLACTLSASPAFARLGEQADTVGADMGHMRIHNHQVSTSKGQAVHTLDLANGDTVKEYVNADGVVYAVGWNGPGKPDLRDLLGSHFAVFQQDNASARRRGIRSAPRVVRSDLSVVTGGHPGSFWGMAWLPQAAPAGFNPNAM